MTRWAVTVNVGGSFVSQAVRGAMLGWAGSALERDPIFVFAQEVPSQDWLNVWIDAGYTCVLGPDRGWKVRSALLAAPGQPVVPLLTPAGSVGDPALNTLDYHGSYVAAARWSSARGDVVLASVHASPTEADLTRYGWAGTPVTPRTGGGDPRYPGERLWDSDLLLETLISLTKLGPLLTAGDFNEALGFDVNANGTQIGTWGVEYFNRMRDSGLTSWLAHQWETERPTHGRLQLDHIVLSESADGILSSRPEPHLDDLWSDTVSLDTLGDHVPIWFAVAQDWIPATS